MCGYPMLQYFYSVFKGYVATLQGIATSIVRSVVVVYPAYRRLVSRMAAAPSGTQVHMRGDPDAG